MWFRGPDSDIAWFILIFVIVSLGVILSKFYILNKKKQRDESEKADLKASKTFIVICILTLILVPSGIIMYDNYIYQAKDIIDRADGQVKQADSKSNTIKKLLEIVGRLGRSAETAEEAKKLEEISKKLRGPKNKKHLTDEDVALINKYRHEWDPKFKPAPAPVIKTVPDLLKANKNVDGFSTEITPAVEAKIKSKEYVLLPGLEYVPAKNGKPASIDWDGKTMNTGVIYDGKKFTTTGTYRGEATPEELRSAGIEPTPQPAPAPEKAKPATEAPEPVVEPVAAKDTVPETAELPGVKNPQPEAPPPKPAATKTPSGRAPTARPQNVTTIPELMRDKAVSSLLSLRERLLSSVPKNFSELKHGFQEYLENMRNPNLGSLELYKAQQKLLANRAKQLRTELKLDENGNYLIPGITPSKPKPEPVLKATYPTPEASGALDQQMLIPFNEPIKGLDRLLETKPKPIPETNVSELKVNNPDQLGLDSMRGSSVDPIKTKVDPDGQVAFEWANPRTEPKEPVLKISPAPENPNRDLGQQLHISWNKPIQGLGDNFLKPEPKHLRDGQYVFDWYSKPMNPLAFIRKLLKRTPKTEAVERIPDHPDQLKFDFMAEPGGGKNTKKPTLRGLWTDDFWNKGKAKIEAKAKAEAAAKAKEQAKAEAAANERLRENYGPEENELFGSNRTNGPQADTQATKPGTGSASPKGTVNPGAASQAGAQPTGAAVSDFVKAMLNPKENGKQLFHGAKTIMWDPIFHPFKTGRRAVKGVTGAALGATSAATMMNAGLNATEDGQPVSWWNMAKNLPESIYNQITGETDTIPDRTTILPAPNGSENNDSKDSADNVEETSTDSQNTDTDTNKNKGTIVTSFLPEKLKNISVNGYPVGGSLFGALAGGALGAGFGGLNYILTDDNELSEEEKKKRSLARAMLSSAGIGAGIGGAIGGLDDWGRSA